MNSKELEEKYKILLDQQRSVRRKKKNLEKIDGEIDIKLVNLKNQIYNLKLKESRVNTISSREPQNSIQSKNRSSEIRRSRLFSEFLEDSK